MYPNLFNFEYKFRCHVTNPFLYTRLTVEGLETTTIKISLLPVSILLRLPSCFVECDFIYHDVWRIHRVQSLRLQTYETETRSGKATIWVYWLPLLASTKIQFPLKLNYYLLINRKDSPQFTRLLIETTSWHAIVISQLCLKCTKNLTGLYTT